MKQSYQIQFFRFRQEKFFQLFLLIFSVNFVCISTGICQSAGTSVKVDTYYRHAGDHPDKRTHLFWGDNDALTDGITHDDNNWYITTLGTCSIGDILNFGCGGSGYIPGKPNGNWSIRQIPVEHDLNDGYQAAEWVKSSEPALASYGHAGDLDHCRHNGVDYLVVPLTGGVHPAIAFFTTNPIKYVNYAYLDLENIGWCAVHPINGDLYTSSDDADAIIQYSINWTLLLNPVFKNIHTALTFHHKNPLDKTIRNMQGGEFTPTGMKLYISCGVFDVEFNDKAQNPEDGIHVFNTLDWKEIQRSTNQKPGRGRPAETGPFDYTFDNNANINSDEPEGLTIWDLDDKKSPNISGQLHVLLYNHHYPGTNAVTLKHYGQMNGYDECSMALPLNPCDKIITTNELATTSKSIPAITGYAGDVKDVWFKIAPLANSTTESFSIETYQVPGGLTHTVIQVLSGTCGHLREIASNDGVNNGGHAKVTISNQTNPDPIFIRVTDYGGNHFGKFGIYYKTISPGSNIFSSHQILSGDKSIVQQYPTLTGDVNGDGRTDLIFEGQDWGGNTNLCVRVKLGNADGTFTELPQQNFGDGNAVHDYPLLIGDVNGDGKADLIFEGQDWGGNTNLCVRVKLGNKDGTFTALPQQNFGDGNGVHDYPALVADVNGDGRTDLIFEGQDWGGNTNLCVRVKLGNKDGTFTALPQQNFGDGNAVHDYPLLIGDVNGDGRKDLIFEGQDWGGNTNLCVRVKLGNADGTFTALPQQNLGDGSAVHDYPALVGDVNGDGRTDLIFKGQDWGGNTNLCVRVKLGNADGTFTALPQQNFGDGSWVHDHPTLIGDINGDGKTDLIFMGNDWSGCGLNIRVKLSNGDGTWCKDWQVTGDENTILTYPPLVGDVNNDHKTDILFVFRNAEGNMVINTKISNSNYLCNPQTQSAAPNNLSVSSDYLIYPNPTNNYFQIRSATRQFLQVKLFNSQGYLIQTFNQFTTNADRVDMSFLQNGIYFIETINLKTMERISKKIIKIR